MINLTFVSAPSATVTGKPSTCAIGCQGRQLGAGNVCVCARVQTYENTRRPHQHQALRLERLTSCCGTQVATVSACEIQVPVTDCVARQL